MPDVTVRSVEAQTMTQKLGPTDSQTLGRVQKRLDQLNRELHDMPSWRRQSQWHLDRAGEFQTLLAQRDQLRKRLT
jgi:hypothetical protein